MTMAASQVALLVYGNCVYVCVCAEIESNSIRGLYFPTLLRLFFYVYVFRAPKVIFYYCH